MVRLEASGVERWCDRLLDAFLVLMATWTLVYHLCVVVRLGTTWAVALEVVALAVTGLLLRRLRRSPEELPPPAAGPTTPVSAAAVTRHHRLVVVTAVAAGCAALGTATNAPWVLVWVPWLVAARAGIAAAALRLGTSRPDPSGAPDAAGADSADEGDGGSGSRTALVVLLWTLAMAVASVLVRRPNPDDLFYLNYSQWVTAHGTFPIRDTLFSDLVYPMANWPPVASYDGLVGTLGRLTNAHAASVEYLAVPPIASALAVLALWRLLRAWRVQRVALVLSVALLFLAFDGTSAYATPGNLFVTRLWQGKVILLCVVVPLLLTHALRYVERPTRRRLVPLAVGGVAAVGLSTTAIFLVPLLAVGGMLPLVRSDRRRALEGFVAMAAYALGAGIVTVLIGGRSADDFGGRRLYRFDASWIGHQVFLSGLVALIGVLAVLLGALLLPHPAARLTTGVLVLFTGLVLVPGATELSYAAAGLGPTLWRLSWAITVAALVGVAVLRAGSALEQRLRDRPQRRWAIPGIGVLLLALLAVFGSPIWAADTTSEIRAPFHWQRSYSSRAVVSGILEATRPGDLVLAPDSISITLAVTTTDVKAVAPRDYYMHYLSGVPGFHYRARLALVHAVNDDIPADTPGLGRDLRVLGVDVACTSILDGRLFRRFRAAGYTPLLTTTYYRCLHKT
ncbi:DUF6077 domain-containing protein [Nocardioides cynanchi]|uniref:DUF6077 domain-containing protein n=1 Tax=Nocardioides cynanchi TaxID=2558918 RepID=UPI001246CB47|nr:DUF6077 domain-containing protein [Nocardioides cynanchi]